MEKQPPFNYIQTTDLADGANGMEGEDGAQEEELGIVTSKERVDTNQSYIGLDQRRYNTSKKDGIRPMNNTSYNFPNVTPLTTKRKQGRADGRRMIDVEQFKDPDSMMRNSNILNVVSPTTQKPGFHITDLIENNTIKRKTQLHSTEPMNNTSIFDGRNGSHDSNPLATPQSLNRTFRDNKYIIKNFRLVNLNDQGSKNLNRTSKPITAAPMSYNNSGAKAIQRITAGSSRKDRFNSSSNMSRFMKSSHPIQVTNSLLIPDEKEQYKDMRPVEKYFEQFFEETHYMFPKHKSKFGLNPKSTFQSSKYNSVTRAPVNPIEEEKHSDAGSRRGSVINELRKKAMNEKGM
jgi:hypothetical protein